MLLLLRPSKTPSEDIMLRNVGIVVLPDAEAAAVACPAGAVRGADTCKGFDAKTVHKTFNHRNPRTTKHRPDCTRNAPDGWRKFDAGACDDLPTCQL